MRIDLISTNTGSIISIAAASARGQRWLERHVAGPDARTGVIYAEHRYGVDILTGALAAGLTLRDATSGRIAAEGQN